VKLRVAAWQYPIEHLASWDAWLAKLAAGLADAAARGARLVVVPEYAAMELTSLSPAATLATQLDALQPLLPGYLDAYAELARRHNLIVVGGSFPERLASGEVRNRARVHAGHHAIAIDKLMMTRFEAEQWGIAAGAGQTVIDLGGARLGVAICYDSEFPVLVRRLVTAGADIIAVPSCTDTRAGYHRVRVACQARALENQCYVVQAPTVGQAPWSIAVDANTGSAGVFAPPDRGFPDDGIVALGPYSEPGWIVADLDLDAVAYARRDGQVLNHRDWNTDRNSSPASPVEHVALR
jgi:predicted amidohydrolase